MKKMNDEELQKWLEENGRQTNGPLSDDAKAYNLLFNLLEAEPDKGLPYDFASKVTRRVKAEQKRNSDLRSYLLSLLVVGIVAAAVYGLLLLTKNKLGNGLLNVIVQYKWAFILSIFSFLTVQYLDAALIKANIFKRPH